MNERRLPWLLFIVMVLGIILAALLQLDGDRQPLTAVDARETSAVIDATVAVITRNAVRIPTLDSAIATPDNLELLYELVQAWPLVAYDAYDDNQRGWSQSEENDEFAQGTRRVSGGFYIWDMTGYRDFTFPAAAIEAPFNDFYVAVDVNKQDKQVGHLNLIFRYQNGDNYFDYGLCADNRSYQVWRQLNDSWRNLIECTAHDAIRPQQTNRLAVIAQGTRYLLYVNGKYVDSVDDDTFSDGNVGVAIELDQAQRNIFVFDNFELRAPETD